MADLGKGVDMAGDEVGMDGSALMSAEAKAHRLAYNIYGVR